MKTLVNRFDGHVITIGVIKETAVEFYCIRDGKNYILSKSIWKEEK